jgi:hypothetical protein
MQPPHVARDAGPPTTVDCWSCDTPNIPSRLFCVACGSFIAIGSGAAMGGTSRRSWRAAASHPELRASAEVRPGAPLAEAPAPFVAGAMPLGSYSEAARRRATRRARTLTAVTSVALTLVVGLAALYVALPVGDENGDPRTAALPAVSAAPADLATDAPTDLAADVSTTEPGGEPTDEPDDEVVAGAVEPTPELVAVPVSGIEITVPAPGRAEAVEPGSDAESEAGVEPEPEPDPVDEREPEPEVQPESEGEPGSGDSTTDTGGTSDAGDTIDAGDPDPAAADVTNPAIDANPATETDPAADAAPARGWVCEGPVRVEDSRVRDWSLGRVTFRARPGFERIVLHLERSGQGAGETPSVTASVVPTARLNGLMPGIRRPALGRSTIGVRLADGIGGNLALRGYRPNGLAVVKEFSVYPAGVGGRNVLISTASEGCFRLRVPAWSDPSASVRRAEVLIDVRS